MLFTIVCRSERYERKMEQLRLDHAEREKRRKKLYAIETQYIRYPPRFPPLLFWALVPAIDVSYLTQVFFYRLL